MISNKNLFYCNKTIIQRKTILKSWKIWLGTVWPADDRILWMPSETTMKMERINTIITLAMPRRRLQE